MKNSRFRNLSMIRKASEFKVIFDHGRRFNSGHIVLLLSQSSGSAYGIAVSRNIGCIARRNRVKRRIREVIYRLAGDFPQGKSIVLLAKRGADRLLFSSLQTEIVDLLARVR